MRLPSVSKGPLAWDRESRRGGHRYRIALYGGSGSGKTCILAALAMSRREHPQGFSCTWSTRGHPEEREWLQEAIDKLQEGDVPPGNPTVDTPLAFEFTFAVDGRTYLTEIIDYAGELIGTPKNESEFARNLFECLRTMDALLVLAPAPYPGNDYHDLSNELNALQRTFVTLRKKAPDAPVGLLINMWDRRSPLEYKLPNNEWKELEEFLFKMDPPPPHRVLYDTLKNSLPSGRDFREFPVSAFGEYERVTKGDKEIERPKNVNPLHPFQLLDPFIWALQRRDELDLESLEHRTISAKRRGWLGWPPLRLSKQAQALRKRFQGFPQDADELCRVEKISEAIKRMLWQRASILSPVVLATFMTAELAWDSVHYSAVLSVLRNPTSPIEQVVSAERTLERYAGSPFWRHILYKHGGLGTNQAFAKLDQSRSRRRETQSAQENALWQEVLQAETPERRAERAKALLAMFPKGNHEVEAHTLITEAVRSVHWNDFVTKYRALMEDGRLNDAARELDRYSPATSDLVRLKAEFQSQAVQQLRSKLQEWKERGAWEEANRDLRNADAWPASVRSRELQAQLRNLREELYEAWDRDLYLQAQRDRTLERLQSYLSQAPLGSMKNDVQQFLDYLSRKQDGRDVRLVIAGIRWAEDVTSRSKLRLEVLVDGTPQLDKDELPGTSDYRGKFEPLNIAIPLKRRLSDEVKIKVRADANGLFGFGHTDLGISDNVVVTVESLGGYELALKDGASSIGHAVFGLAGIEPAPQLPSWRK